MREGVTSCGTSTSVRFGVGELERCRAAAALEGVRFNAWVRRACVRQLEQEAALRAEALSAQNGVVVSGPLPPSAVDMARAKRLDPARSFRPDFKR